jgi:hypothetical protein
VRKKRDFDSFFVIQDLQTSHQEGKEVERNQKGLSIAVYTDGDVKIEQKRRENGCE